MLWGLIPHWSKEKKTGYSLINARMETLKTKSAFRPLISSKRCLVPADGFFEWKKSPHGKIPYRVGLKSGKPFAFASLWDSWKGENGEQINSFTIITTEANSLVANLHDRMPVILKQEEEPIWLNTDIHEYDKLKPLFQPYPADKMTLYEVSPVVNSWKNDTIECVEPKGS